MEEKQSFLPLTVMAILIIIVVFLAIRFGDFGKKSEEVVFADDSQNATYIIEGEEVMLQDGHAEKEAAPGSATKIITSIFGELTKGDLDGDGDDDAALLLVRDLGGSGTFYYLAVAENIDGKFKGTNAILLGDRIAPQTIEIRDGVLIGNYATRLPDEPMTDQPSVGVSKYAKLLDGRLLEIWHNMIFLESPLPESKIVSPLVIKGQARGNWFFEASFPIVLTNWDGLIIAQGIAQAKSDWMTTDFVPFEATLEFVKPEFIGDFSKRGSLILKKDNPSGLPEHDDALEITVWFE
ncbi:MAG: Gmad2 immunoglobulin-like domain-containing protein [Candidatus Paceibacterota bacterium]|jgi:hypothetical protein